MYIREDKKKKAKGKGRGRREKREERERNKGECEEWRMINRSVGKRKGIIRGGEKRKEGWRGR
jgi:hypothetical protein